MLTPCFSNLTHFVASYLSSMTHHYNRHAPLTLLCNPFVSQSFPKSHKFNKIPRAQTVRSSCCLSSDDKFHDQPPFHLQGLGRKSSEKEGEGPRNRKKMQCATSRNSPFIGNKHLSGEALNSHLRFDFLGPMMIGIKPGFLDWSDQDLVICANIEQKAKSLDFPLTLRMIKKKLKFEEGLTESEGSGHCSVKAAFTSMVYMLVELQSHTLQMRKALRLKDSEVISSKVQKEMHSSFIWLFQQVFSRTPALMLHVMVLLANFIVYSATHNIAISDEHVHMNPVGIFSCDQSEVKLWNSMVDEVKQVEILDDETVKYLVSPVFVELEPDGYEEYLRTELLYQMNLSQEPNNPLLLCNYAQFLHLVARDYDRAEECFKQAVQTLPHDPESIVQYGRFLWMVRRDVLGAEERFLQALSIEPDNFYYAGAYANFLWSMGGEGTSFFVKNSTSPNQ